MREPITQFSGEYRFLSNFWPAQVSLDGIQYPTVEHAYQASKTLDEQDREWIQRAQSPAVAKRRGGTVLPRPDWTSVKLQIMRNLVQQKFEHPDLRSRLMATEDAELVEGNTWGDTFWGVCNGRGSNHLGIILMEVRGNIGQVWTAQKGVLS